MVPAVPLLLHPYAVSDAVPDDVPLLLHPDADASCTLDLARLLLGSARNVLANQSASQFLLNLLRMCLL